MAGRAPLPAGRRGYSRDGKRGKLQIEFGLLCDAEGRPVAVEVFDGNTADPATVGAQIDKLRRRFGFSMSVLYAFRRSVEPTRNGPDSSMRKVLSAFLKVSGDPELTRVAFELVDEALLRRPPSLELDEVLSRLAATDRRSAAPWTAEVLSLIDSHPATRAGDLAPTMGWETPKFKANVRKLKALGLTQSLEVGYLLTDLGDRAVAALTDGH